MRRINASYAVLSDPEQRREYDREAFESIPLRNPGPMTPGPMPLRRPIQPGSLVWVAVAILSLGVIFWLAIQSQ
jgi:curved DNA-binding protein CbpA